MQGFRIRRWFLIVLLLWAWAPAGQGSPREGVGREDSREGRVLEPDEVARILDAHLQEIVNDPRKRVEVRDLRGAETVVLPAGTLSHEVIVPEQAYRGGPLSATVIFRINGQEKKRIRVSARVELYADVVAASHFLQRHLEIQEKDIQWVRRNIALLPNDVVLEKGEVLNHRTILSVNGQEVLRKGMVEVPPLVKRGDRVIMSVENQRFKITTWGEAKEEGRRGDRIRLVNLSSKKEVVGKVVDATTVRIDY